ncbi:MAG: glycerophosphodiester phosphodiesterase [Rhizobiaceae bacterium]|nr:glycerophosphodiester phosphodiesterase [Rhizobiaceae bacterium]
MNERTINASWITQRPIAHRALHDEANGILENSRSAVLAAVNAGYHIEIDLQLSVDRVPMVFHDYTLERMTSATGELRDRTAAELQSLRLKNSQDTIWPLSELLEIVAGKVGLIIELKGRAGADEGFIQSVAAALKGYQGNVAIMSFNHWLLADANQFAPELILGQTAKGNDDLYKIHEETRLAYNVDFVSYKFADLDCKFVRETNARDMPLICWTIKSQKDANVAYEKTDQITFEGFTPEDLGSTGDMAR